MPIFCSDKEFDASKHPCSKLWCHISQKGIQGGAVLGAAAVVPAMAAHAVLARGVPVQDLKKPEEALKLLSGAAYTAIGAIAATFVVGSLKLLTMDRAGMEDRVYRLHYNTSQRRADHLSQVGGLVGLAAAACLLQGQPSAKPLHYVGGASLGTAAGVLLHVLTRPADMKGRNKMLHELVN